LESCLHPQQREFESDLPRRLDFLAGEMRMLDLGELEAALEPAGAQELTGLLRAWSNGSPGAFEQLLEAIYPELRKIAQRCLSREREGHTLQATALVNEAYLKLVGIEKTEWHDRAHFFAVSARVMRHILVDHARSRGYAKRGKQCSSCGME
jgi:RNA polymerase sigma factor (TIGR02999 family)